MNDFFSDKSAKFFKSSKLFWKFYKTVIKTRKSGEAQTITKIVEKNTNKH